MLPLALLLPASGRGIAHGAAAPYRAAWILDVRASRAPGCPPVAEVIGYTGPGGSDPLRLWQRSARGELLRGRVLRGRVAYSDGLIFGQLARETGLKFAWGSAHAFGGTRLHDVLIGPALKPRRGGAGA